ncbi:MAG: hypothetical protein QM522_11700, partial [Chitinophagaceae bacterium]|nr:hypothetical protein [Chitinophagaceae bacterium]
MPTGSSIGANTATYVVGDAGTGDYDASLVLDADAISVDGVAAANTVATNDVAVLNSQITVGSDSVIDIDEVGTLTASAETINRESTLVAGGGTDTSTGVTVGDLLLNGSGAVAGYITSIGTGVGTGADDDVISWAATPGGSTGTGSATGAALDGSGYEVIASSAFAGTTGATGGFIDSTATDVDLTVGDGATITVDAGNLADADASNVAGDAYATASINETFGFENVGVSVGASGSLTVNVDADALASAESVGDPTVTAAGSGADANANADATTVVGIQDLGDGTGDFVFGDNATVTARAGSSADRVTVAADATTETGNATADADATTVAGILDTQNGTATTANVLQVGNDGTVTGVAYSDFDAAADTTSGDATADATVGAALGIQVDEIVVGDGGVVQGQADTQINVSA